MNPDNTPKEIQMDKTMEQDINDILLKNGFDILENGCCYTDLHRIERVMKSYAALTNKSRDERLAELSKKHLEAGIKYGKDLQNYEQEIERLKGLIEEIRNTVFDNEAWQQFKTKNQL